MNEELTNHCEIHPNAFQCPDKLIHYNEARNEYGLIIHDGGTSYVTISYCPWCGKSYDSSGLI